MEKLENDWREEWGTAIEGQVDFLKEDPWKFKVEDSKKKLQKACNNMKKARLSSTQKGTVPNISESQIELTCLKNFEEGIRYIKSLLADFARHSEAFVLARFQNEQRTEIARLAEDKKKYRKSWLHGFLTGFNLGLKRFLVVVLSIAIVFALIYGFTDVFTDDPVLVQDPQNPVELQFYHYFYFSVVTLATLGYGDLSPNLHMPGIMALAAFESALGMVMLGWFVYMITHLSEIHPYSPQTWMKYYEEKLCARAFF